MLPSGAMTNHRPKIMNPLLQTRTWPTSSPALARYAPAISPPVSGLQSPRSVSVASNADNLADDVVLARDIRVGVVRERVAARRVELTTHEPYAENALEYLVERSAIPAARCRERPSRRLRRRWRRRPACRPNRTTSSRRSGCSPPDTTPTSSSNSSSNCRSRRSTGNRCSVAPTCTPAARQLVPFEIAVSKYQFGFSTKLPNSLPNFVYFASIGTTRCGAKLEVPDATTTSPAPPIALPRSFSTTSMKPSRLKSSARSVAKVGQLSAIDAW